jgi:putative ABC transport system permease protein
MLRYYTRLALKSFARNPGLTVLMVLAFALGISVCVMTLTVYHAMSGNPIWWKNDRLFTVTMDSWDPNRPADDRLAHLPPAQLTYRDATFLFDSAIPERKAIMRKATGIVLAENRGDEPVRVDARVTTADFFPMFDVPFQYGNGWNASADTGPEPVVVLSRRFNEKLFGGVNSVGRTLRWNDQTFRVIGVLAEWMPIPKFYDVNHGGFDEPEELYIPWGWGHALRLEMGGAVGCWKQEPTATYEDLLASECVWIQMWVELPNENVRNRMQAFVDTYWAEQRKAGRFERPQNNRLTNVDRWLEDRRVVRNDNRVLVAISFAFLAVCLLNTIGLLLAKFLNGAAISGVRRALGASRRQIFAQHLVEVGLLAAAGALLGLALSALGLWGVRALYTSATGARGGYSVLAQFDLASIGWAIALAIFAALAAGLYPAWRVGRLPPAVYLKNH